MAIYVLEHSLGRIDGDVSDANTKVYGDVDAPFSTLLFFFLGWKQASENMGGTMKKN